MANKFFCNLKTINSYIFGIFSSAFWCIVDFIKTIFHILSRVLACIVYAIVVVLIIGIFVAVLVIIALFLVNVIIDLIEIIP